VAKKREAGAGGDLKTNWPRKEEEEKAEVAVAGSAEYEEQKRNDDKELIVRLEACCRCRDRLTEIFTRRTCMRSSLIGFL
jgi:hypothetical protein